MNRLTLWFVDLIKRPITIAVLDEVSEVLQSGHYTKNISDALVENHDELVALVAEKVRNDPSSRVVSRRARLRHDRRPGQRDDPARADRDAR